MAKVTVRRKNLVTNPLKHSAPLGGALAFLGINRCVPILHGAQGCTSFAVALLTRHFREPVPIQNTALSETAAILGGGDNLAAALATVAEKRRPDLIGLLTTGLTETRGDDVVRLLADFREQSPQHRKLPVVAVSTPDFAGGLQEGYAAVVEQLVTELAEPDANRISSQVNLLVGPGLGPLDAEEIREMVEAFGLSPIVVPDLAGSLDGHLAEDWSPVTTGGTPVTDVRRLGSSQATLVVGPSLLRTGRLLEKRHGVPCLVYDSLTGLEETDRFLADLASLSGRPVPPPLRRWRARLADGMLDAHFVLGGRRIALALEPDLLYAVASFLVGMGAEIVAAVGPTKSPILERLPCGEVTVGDYGDLEEAAREAGAELLIASSHGTQSAKRLRIPHLSLGFPVVDRLGVQYQLTAGYRGTLSLVYQVANRFLEEVMAG